MGKSKIPYSPDDVDFVNETVAKVTGLSLGFLYQGDAGKEPTRRSLKMNLDEFTRFQQGNDARPTSTTVTCCTCNRSYEDPVPPPHYSISQKMDMSDAWSRELRRKIQEAEDRRQQDVQIRVDPYFEDWE